MALKRRKSVSCSAMDVRSARVLADGTVVCEQGTRELVVRFGKPIRARWTVIGEHYLEGGRMKRREAQSNEQGTAPLCKLMETYPDLYNFLTDTQWDDGKPRETGTMLLFVQEGRYKVALNDRDADASAFVSGRTLTELLLAVEEAITDPTVEWRSKDSPRKKR